MSLRRSTAATIIFASAVLGVGIAAAEGGGDDPTVEEEVTTTTAADVEDVTTTTDTVDTEVDAPDDDATPESGGHAKGREAPLDAQVRPENHGKYVSEAAHTCPKPGHGECVREVAQSDAGKTVQPEDESVEDESDEAESESEASESDDEPRKPAKAGKHAK